MSEEDQELKLADVRLSVNETLKTACCVLDANGDLSYGLLVNYNSTIYTKDQNGNSINIILPVGTFIELIDAQPGQDHLSMHIVSTDDFKKYYKELTQAEAIYGEKQAMEKAALEKANTYYDEALSALKNSQYNNPST